MRLFESQVSQEKDEIAVDMRAQLVANFGYQITLSSHFVLLSLTKNSYHIENQ